MGSRRVRLGHCYKAVVERAYYLGVVAAYGLLRGGTVQHAFQFLMGAGVQVWELCAGGFQGV